MGNRPTFESQHREKGPGTILREESRGSGVQEDKGREFSASFMLGSKFLNFASIFVKVAFSIETLSFFCPYAPG